MAIQFFETKMGRKFYEGTMPKIARSLEVIANSMASEEKKYLLIEWSSDSDALTPRGAFSNIDEAKDAMEKTVASDFNASDLGELTALGHIVSTDDDGMQMEIKDSAKACNINRYTIVEIC